MDLEFLYHQARSVSYAERRKASKAAETLEGPRGAVSVGFLSQMRKRSRPSRAGGGGGVGGGGGGGAGHGEFHGPGWVYDWDDIFISDERRARESQTARARGLPPLPSRDFGLPQGELLSDVLAAWDLTQSFADYLRIPPVPLWRLVVALHPEAAWSATAPLRETDGARLESLTALLTSGEKAEGQRLRQLYSSRRAGEDDGLDPEPGPITGPFAPAATRAAHALGPWAEDAMASAAVLHDIHVGLVRAVSGRDVALHPQPERHRFNPEKQHWLSQMLHFLLGKADRGLVGEEAVVALELLRTRDYAALSTRQRVAIVRALVQVATNSEHFKDFITARVEDMFGTIPEKPAAQGGGGGGGTGGGRGAAAGGPVAAAAAAAAPSGRPRGRPSAAAKMQMQIQQQRQLMMSGDPDAEVPEEGLEAQGLLSGAIPTTRSFPGHCHDYKRGSLEEWQAWSRSVQAGFGRPIGEDHARRRYWVLGGVAGAGRVFVQNPTTGSWGWYERHQLPDLLAWLTAADIQSERGLVQALALLERVDPGAT